LNLEIKNVGKKYRGNIWGLRDLSMTVPPGVLGLLGPNGAGKSTLMRILATITKQTEGGITWKGVDISKSPNKIRTILGYLPQDFGIYPHLNPVEFMTYLAAARGIYGRSASKRIDQLLDLVNLSDSRKRPLGGFSGGMKQRVGIAQALLNDPQLLIVDEPTAGLDPEERVRFRSLLAELSGDRFVVLSSHIVSDVEAVATSIAVLNKGHLLSHDAPENLIRKVDGKTWEMTVPSSDLQDARDKFVVGNAIRSGDGVRIRVVSDQQPGEEASPVSSTLEDAYLYLLANNRNGDN
jgi:ABC-type multidrug transport system ATPase subunit